MFFVVQEWDLKSQQSTHKNCVPEFQILSTLKLRSCGMVIFLNMNNYMLTEDTDFKTFLKESYPIGLDS